MVEIKRGCVSRKDLRKKTQNDQIFSNTLKLVLASSQGAIRSPERYYLH